jgi:Carboxypeptidase regulatory-like domain
MRSIPKLPFVAVCGVLAADALAAQTLRGRLLDDNTEQPIRAAFVILLDDGGMHRDSVITDSTGKFLFHAGAPGHYRIKARRMGYAGTTTPPLKIKAGETLMVDFLIEAIATRLTPVEVTARKRRDDGERLQGLHMREFGQRYVSRQEIRPRTRGARNFSDLLRWQNIPGLQIREGAMGDLCVTVTRSTSGCMDVYLDGSPMSAAHTLDPLTIDRMVVVLPQEAMQLYGSQADKGILLIFSSRGLPTRPERDRLTRARAVPRDRDLDGDPP